MKIKCEQKVEITKKTLRNIIIISLAFNWIHIMRVLLAPERYCFWELVGGISITCLMVYGVVYLYKWSKIHELF